MTAEPPVPFPISPYCRVRARVASIWADGPDDGTHPDWRPAVGEKVTLTPSIASQVLTYDAAGDNPIIVTVERVECVVSVDGWLTKNDGRPVYIAPTDDPLLSVTGWTWTASIKGKTVRFAAPTGGVVDLALFIAAPATDNTKTWVERIPELVALIEAGTNPATIGTIVEDYLAANPPVSDATAITKGVLRLAGDLGGTADAPTVPGLVDKADADHDHGISDVTGLQDALDGKQTAGSYAAATHDHDGTYAPALGPDDNYITDAEKAALHSHANKAALDEVSGVNTGDQDLSDYATTASLSTVATSGAYADLTGRPTIPDSPDDIGAAPASHDHVLADITDYTPPDPGGLKVYNSWAEVDAETESTMGVLTTDDWATAGLDHGGDATFFITTQVLTFEDAEDTWVWRRQDLRTWSGVSTGPIWRFRETSDPNGPLGEWRDVEHGNLPRALKESLVSAEAAVADLNAYPAYFNNPNAPYSVGTYTEEWGWLTGFAELPDDYATALVFLGGTFSSPTQTVVVPLGDGTSRTISRVSTNGTSYGAWTLQPTIPDTEGMSTMSAAMGVVHHTTADAPRPNYAAVYWSGELEPINALPGDIWRNA